MAQQPLQVIIGSKQDLTEKAMLVALNISQWTARKYDRRVSEEVASDYGTTTEAGRYNKVLIAKGALKSINQIVGAARSHHYTNTLPWRDDGYRMLPTGNYWQYCEDQRAFRDQFDRAVNEFVASYPGYINAARDTLQGLFDQLDYPLPDDIGRRFRFETVVMPMPDSADFRVSLARDEVAQIRDEIERRTAEAAEAAIGDLWQRIHDTVRHMAARLRMYRVTDDGVEHPFRDSMVTNLRALVDLLPRLNFTGDSRLAAMCQRLNDELCPHEPDDLREDEGLRSDTAKAAERILADMAGYC